MNITFRGKQIEVEELAEGVAKKTDSIYYVRCIKTGDWLYACKSRFDKLVAQAGSVEELGKVHLGRPGKKMAKTEVPAEVKTDVVEEAVEEVAEPAIA